MKHFFLLLMIFLITSCNQSTNTFLAKSLTLSKFWISKDIKFNSSHSNPFGEGTIYYFSSDNTFKTFSNDFAHKGDSITWGEPGIILRKGTWTIQNKSIILKHNLVFKTFLLPIDDTINIKIDTIIIKDKIMIDNHEKQFIPVNLITKELQKFISSEWSTFQNKLKTR